MGRREVCLTPESRNWLDWAIRYAEQGWRVFPLLPGSKAPYPGTRGKSDASRDPDQFIAWLEAAERIGDGAPNLGIVPPEGCAIIDVDPRDGGALPDGLPQTLTQRSGGGGWHVVVRTGETPLRGTLGPGIQVKTHTNGYIVAEPSIHPDTGRPYEWERTTDKIATCPEHILERITRKGRESVSDAVTTDAFVGRLTAEKIESLAETLAGVLHSGQKHNTVLAYGGWAVQQGIRPDDTAQIVEQALTLEGSAEDVAAGVDTALWAYESDSKFGWQKLTEVLSPEECEAIEAGSPYRERLGAMADRMSETWARIAERQRQANTDPKLDWYGAGRVVPWDSDPRPIESLIEGFPVYRSERNALIGNPSAGKTPTALTLALAVSNGAPWMGRNTTKSKTTYVTYESPEATFALARALAKGNGWDTNNVTFVEAVPGALATPAGRQTLVEAVIATGTEFLVLETYDSACSGLNPNDAPYAMAMKELHIPGVAVLVSVHCPKSAAGLPPKHNDMIGTGTIGGSIKGSIGIHRPDPSDKFLFELTCARARSHGFPSMRIRYADTDLGVAMRIEPMPDFGTETSEKKPSAAQVRRDEERIALNAVRRWAVDADPTKWVGLSDVDQACAIPVGRDMIEMALVAASKDGPPLVKVAKRDGGVMWYRPTSRTEREELRPLDKVDV